MSNRPAIARQRFQTWLEPKQRRGVRVLAWASLVSLVGVTLTGLWQFATHETDPQWFGYVSGAEIASSSSTGVAELHAFFADAVAVIALFGGAWFAYRVLYDIPRPAVIAVALAVLGQVSGSVMRFNLVKLRGREFEDAGRGYAQIFGGNLEFVVTDRFELGPTAIRLWTIGHIATVPILLVVIWLGLPTADDAEA